MKKLNSLRRVINNQKKQRILVVGGPETGKSTIVKEIEKNYKSYVSVEGLDISADLNFVDDFNDTVIVSTDKLFNEYMIYRFDIIIFLKNDDKLTIETAEKLLNQDITKIKNLEFFIHRNFYTDISNMKNQY